MTYKEKIILNELETYVIQLYKNEQNNETLADVFFKIAEYIAKIKG